VNSITKHRYALFGTLLAFINLYLSYLFRFDLIPIKLPYTLIENILYLDNPVYNFGGFFVDGSEPTIYRLPTIFILLYVSYNLYKYLLKPHTKSQTIFAVLLLGGVGGLTLDILSYGSVCDWLGFMIPGSRYYSLLNISDLMILISAPFAALLCIPNFILKVIAFIFSILVIGANSYYHFIALYNLII
jgi:lipoprotein signal peptidase